MTSASSKQVIYPYSGLPQCPYCGELVTDEELQEGRCYGCENSIHI